MHLLLGDTLASLINDHAIQPGSRFIQASMIPLSMFSAMSSVGSHHQEHWAHAVIRPVGRALSGMARKTWSGRQDSNLRPLVPQTSTLTT